MIVTDEFVEKACEHIMERRRESEPHDTPHWKDYIADSANKAEVDKWRFQTRHALEAVLPMVVEKCAKVAENYPWQLPQGNPDFAQNMPSKIATAIRALGR